MIHELAEKIDKAMNNATYSNDAHRIWDSTIRTWLEEKAKEINDNMYEFTNGVVNVRQILGLEKEWCEHITASGNLSDPWWLVDSKNCYRASTDRWVMCPICGAKRP